VADVHAAIEAHHAHLASGGGLAGKRRAGLRREVEERIVETLSESTLRDPEVAEAMRDGIERVLRREESPYHLARALTARIAARAAAAAGAGAPGGDGARRGKSTSGQATERHKEAK
jgi:hypothetical protein